MTTARGARQYFYNELRGDDSFRLLRLRPGRETQDLECELLTSSLQPLDPLITTDPPHGAEYEAVSWYWGKGPENRHLRVLHEQHMHELPISESLEQCMRGLRYDYQERMLWIDAICIHQKNIAERNQQVPKMNRIYGQAKCVLVWIGDKEEPTATSIGSDKVLQFIITKVLKIWEFDRLCEDLRAAKEWYGFINLMKRPWFSRRWVVQEIALARTAVLYCGRKWIEWQDFVDAVSLFVEVESATHRLSEVMRQDQQFYNIPEFFGHVPSLGAAQLVDATSNLFRKVRKGKRDPLLSLEYLVSKYYVFEATQPRDTIYAMLSIAKDTNVLAVEAASALPQVTETKRRLQSFAQPYIKARTFRVNYEQPLVEVYKSFIQFSIYNSEKTRALDIVLRPWAPRIRRKDDRAGLMEEVDGVGVFQQKSDHDQEDDANNAEDEELPLPSWIPGVDRAPTIMSEHPTAGLRMERINADPLVGLPAPAEKSYAAAGTRPFNAKRLSFKTLKTQYSMLVEGVILDEIATVEEPARLGNLPPTWLKAGGWELWRTLVADRGPAGYNAPSFYPRACIEAVQKMAPGNPVNTSQIINEGRCTIVAQFLRRLQAVIWNRRLIRTKNGRLGLANIDVSVGDAVCIFYGCSVPVILHKHVLHTKEDLKQEAEEQAYWEGASLEKIRPFVEIGLKRLRSKWAAKWAAEKDQRAGVSEAKVQAVSGSASANSPIQRPTKDPATSDTSTHSDHAPMPARNRPSQADVSTEPSMTSTEVPNVSLQHGPEDETNQKLSTEQEDTPREECRPVDAHGEPEAPDMAKVSKTASAGGATGDHQESTSQPEKTEQAQEELGAEDVNKPAARFYWKLLGECYVHGMMDGEAIAWQNREEKKAEMFDLR